MAIWEAATIKFYGYLRPDGQIGIRNHIAIISTVVCANDVAQAVTNHVRGTVGLFHHQGCCQLSPDLERVTETLSSLSCSPNVGAVLLVHLGCEGTDLSFIERNIEKSGKAFETIKIQELGGFSNALKEGILKAQELSVRISSIQRTECDVSNVIMSIKCGASDATSGLASNCVIGYVSDRLIDMGATVVFGETTEFIGAEHILAQRAINDDVRSEIYGIVTAMENRAKSLGVDMRKGQPTPGNITGGLSSIEEKSLGAIVKSGTKPIEGVLKYPDSAYGKKGLWIKDTPGREPEILTGMAASGSQFMLFSTGRGAPQGYPIMPVVKICGNPNTYEKMKYDMDINAGFIIDGKKNIEEIGEEVLVKIENVMNGEFTKNEAVQYYNSIDIHTLGPVI